MVKLTVGENVSSTTSPVLTLINLDLIKTSLAFSPEALSKLGLTLSVEKIAVTPLPPS